MTTGKTLTLRSLDIPTIHKFGIGFDSLFDEMIRINAQQSSSNYPPYNIVQINEDEYMVSLAVAGFGPDNIEVTKEQNYLIIEGNPVHPIESANYLHKGISTRNFRREFKTTLILPMNKYSPFTVPTSNSGIATTPFIILPVY